LSQMGEYATQDQPPIVREEIDRVGVEGVQIPLRIIVNGLEQTPIFRASVYIDLDGSKKGVHMSRLTESLVAIALKQERHHLTDIAMDILDEIEKKHPYTKGEVIFRGRLAALKETPVSGRKTLESYPVYLRVKRWNGGCQRTIGVTVTGSTLCPHSLSVTGGKAHSQRATLTVLVRSGIESPLTPEQLIEAAESCLSSVSFTVLKTPDEVSIVDRMYSNPKFVEDLARDCVSRLKQLNVKGLVKVRAKAYESIHRHDAVSEIVRVLR
jgi:GTP cyclohydrolase-4